ncbi:transcriptional regulator [Pelagovum pacificum]|uniref:Transcriptional regulator n=2 Tax=Pelagovum pacificum TaxID=2588711 RepID=A0A5C5GI48_9RHOB|nr:transcriptional regulator [Pelagovum pacificum]
MVSDRDLLSAIREDLPRLTPKLRAIGAAALDDTERFIRNTSREICTELGTSEPTLLRFCQHFGHSGLSDFRIDLALSLARQPSRNGLVEPLGSDRRAVNLDAKRAIARRAVPLIEGDSTILIDNGSTAEFFAASLADVAPLTIMTTGLIVAQNAMTHGQHTVMMTGGRIRPNQMCLTGGLVEQSVSGLRFDTFVMGADSIDAGLGLSTFREDEARQTRAMVEAASRVVVLADGTKFSKPALHKICDLDRVSILVTERAGNEDALDAIRARGVEVILLEGHRQEILT